MKTAIKSGGFLLIIPLLLFIWFACSLRETAESDLFRSAPNGAQQPEKRTSSSERKILAELRALDRLPIPHYYIAPQSSWWASSNRRIAAEVIRISGTVCFGLDFRSTDADKAVALELLAADEHAVLGIFSYPFSTTYSYGNDIKLGWNKHVRALQQLGENLEELREMLGDDVDRLKLIIFEQELFQRPIIPETNGTRDASNDRWLHEKYAAVERTAAEIFPDVRVTWYACGTRKLFPPGYEADWRSPSLYRPSEPAEQVAEWYRGLGEADVEEAYFQMPFLSLGAGFTAGQGQPGRHFLLDLDYPVEKDREFAVMLRNFPLMRFHTPAMCSYPEPSILGGGRTPDWLWHFIAYCEGWQNGNRSE